MTSEMTQNPIVTKTLNVLPGIVLSHAAKHMILSQFDDLNNFRGRRSGRIVYNQLVSSPY